MTRKIKLTTVFLVLALFATNTFWAYRVFDLGVTLTYMEASFDHIRNQYEQMVVLSNLQLVGLSAEEAKERIGKDIRGLDPFVKEGCLWVGQVCLRLQDNVVVGIGSEAQ